MFFFLIAYVFVCLWGVKINFSSKINEDYLSINNTQAIKGIFILLVFFSHFNSYVSFENGMDIFYEKIISVFGQTMVTLFLFYSGYGVVESIKKKGLPYINQIPYKRVLVTLLKFDVAVVLFLIAGLALREEMLFSQIVLSFFAWDSIGNSNWYIECM